METPVTDSDTNIVPFVRRRPTPRPLRWCAFIAWCITWAVLGPPMVALAIISIIVDGMGDAITRWHLWLWEVANNGR